MIRLRLGDRPSGQAIAEFAIVFPIAFVLILAMIVLGLLVFYQQQLTNIAREGARFAAIHSAEVPCPTASWRDPQGAARPNFYPIAPLWCDGPNAAGDPYPWPKMTDRARSQGWGLNASAVFINACWSGYAPTGTVIATGQDYSPPFPQADNPPVDPATGNDNVFAQCTIDRIDPVAATNSLDCRARMTTTADDPASDIPGNQATVYACYRWAPPFAGLLFVPSVVTLRAVVTEVVQNQG
jgi:hypothetical protein